jgi:hypothetical protein
MAQVVDGRYTARMDEPFAVFIIGMWLSLHKDPAAIDCRVTRARSTEVPHTAPYCSTRLGDYAHGPDRARQ